MIVGCRCGGDGDDDSRDSRSSSYSSGTVAKNKIVTYSVNRTKVRADCGVL